MFRKWSKMVRKWCTIVRKLSGNVRKWSQIIRILSKIYKQTKWRKNIYVQQQKKETLNHPPHFYGSILFLCSFLFFLLKSFHMAM